VVLTWSALGLTAVATAFDLRSREIPDAVPLALVAVALLAAGTGAHPAGLQGLLLGAASGLVVGAIAFGAGALGGGDAKLIAALGACLGASILVRILLLAALAGGLLAALAFACRQREFAAAPAIAVGTWLEILVEPTMVLS